MFCARGSGIGLFEEFFTLSTVQKAKGLQFDTVVVLECVEGVYLWWNTETDEASNEDARVLYGAMTRAMKRLILARHTIFLNQWGKRFPRRKSPFLECVGPLFPSGGQAPTTSHPCRERVVMGNVMSKKSSRKANGVCYDDLLIKP